MDGASPRRAGAAVTTAPTELCHTREVASTPTLFAPDLPAGFRYAPDFITAAEEAALVAVLTGVSFSNFAMRGVVARRRVAFFGASYDAGAAPIAPLPEFLLPLRMRLAAWVGLYPALFAMALVNEYPPGAPIGWHRDAPQYDLVAGVSLLSACRMKLTSVRLAGRACSEKRHAARADQPRGPAGGGPRI